MEGFSIKDIVNHFDNFIEGQDAAKIELAKALFVHKYNIHNEEAKIFREKEKLTRSEYIYPHILLTGATGSGKTELVTIGAEFIGLPIIDVDSASLTPSGYVGNSLADIIMDRMAEISLDEHCNRAIVFLDEFDKIVGVDGMSGDTVKFKKAVQYELLRALEGTTLVSDSANSRKGNPGVDTHRFMFILAGNFPDLRKEKLSSDIGFGSKAGTKTSASTGKHILESLQDVGFASQALGRINFVGNLDRLTREQLLKIASDKNMALASIHKLAEDSDSVISKEILNGAVDLSLKTNLGARGLRFDALNSVLNSIYDRDLVLCEKSDIELELIHLTEKLSKLTKDKNNIYTTIHILKDKIRLLKKDLINKNNKFSQKQIGEINFILGDAQEDLDMATIRYSKVVHEITEVSKELKTLEDSFVKPKALTKRKDV